MTLATRFTGQSPRRLSRQNRWWLGAMLVIAVIFGLYYNNQPGVATITIPKSKVSVGETITIPITIDTAGHTINAAEAYLTFNPAAVQIVSVNKEPSFFQLWIKDQPVYNNERGEISFAGGLPTPGFKGKGSIGSISLKLLTDKSAQLVFTPKTRILLNDGEGTAVPLRLRPLTIYNR